MGEAFFKHHFYWSIANLQYTMLLVLSAQQSDSVIYKYIYIFFFRLLSIIGY